MTNSSGGEEFRVLVVDDNYDAAKTLSMLLRTLGGKCRYVVESQQAVAAAEEFRPHCIISDLSMPRLSGFELAKRFRRHHLFGRTPLIANSASSDDRRAKEAGFDYSLTKPQSTLAIADLILELQVMNKSLEKSEQTSRQGTEVVAEVRDLIKEVRDDVKEIKSDLRTDVEQLKSELREVKEDVKELRDELSSGREPDAPSGSEG